LTLFSISAGTVTTPAIPAPPPSLYSTQLTVKPVQSVTNQVNRVTNDSVQVVSECASGYYCDQ